MTNVLPPFPEADGAGGRVVVGVDGSASSDHALRWAHRLVWARLALGLRCRSLMTWLWSGPAVRLTFSHSTRRRETGKSPGANNLAGDASVCRIMCKEAHMATNLALDPELLDRALEVSGVRTKKAAVTLALQEFIARREQVRLLDLMGTLEWDDSYDYKAERSRA